MLYRGFFCLKRNITAFFQNKPNKHPDRLKRSASVISKTKVENQESKKYKNKSRKEKSYLKKDL
jgi:hypothetical protein